MMPVRAVTRVSVLRYGEVGRSRHSDRVATEEPLEIRLAYRRGGRTVVQPVAVTMRTPGDDVELSVGFLYGERILTEPGSVLEVAHCAGGGEQHLNVVEVRLAPGASVDDTLLGRS